MGNQQSYGVFFIIEYGKVYKTRRLRWYSDEIYAYDEQLNKGACALQPVPNPELCSAQMPRRI